MQLITDLIRKMATGISVPEAYKVRERALSPSHGDDVPDYVRDRRDPKTPEGKPGEKWDAQKKLWKGWKPLSNIFKKMAEMLKNEKYVWKKTQKGDAKTLMYKSPETGKEFHVSP
jgi:hypothetical protein